MTAALEIFSARDPQEDRVLTISFAGTNRLLAGETLVSATWMVEHDDGTASATVVSGVCDVSEHPLAKQLVKGGTHNTTDLHRVRALTSTARYVTTGGLQSVYKGA